MLSSIYLYVEQEGKNAVFKKSLLKPRYVKQQNLKLVPPMQFAIDTLLVK